MPRRAKLVPYRDALVVPLVLYNALIENEQFRISEPDIVETIMEEKSQIS